MIDFTKFDIYIDNEDKTEDIESIREENDSFRIKFFNTTKEYFFNKTRIILVEKNNSLRINVFDYYKEIAKTIGLKLNNENMKSLQKDKIDSIDATVIDNQLNELEEDDLEKFSTTTILGKQYDNLRKINALSVLHQFLNGSFLTKKLPDTIIYPFGMNQSQKEAIENALSNQVSSIEGPPGTGKTQTILNIIANLIYNDQTVAVVSNNNSAIENVLDKLKKKY